MLRMVLRFLLLTLVIFCFNQQGQAAITVDPDNTGANDVTVNGLPLHLFSPLPDNLDLTGFELVVGDIQDGKLIINDGSTTTTSKTLLSRNNGTGEVIVKDFGSMLIQEQLRLGFHGNNNSSRLLIENGGNVVADQSYLSSLGEITISGNGSRWESRNFIEAGASSSINVSNMGQIMTDALNTYSGSIIQVDSEGVIRADNLNIYESEVSMSGGGRITSPNPILIPTPLPPLSPFPRPTPIPHSNHFTGYSFVESSIQLVPFPFEYYLNSLDIFMSGGEIKVTDQGKIFSNNTQINTGGGRNGPPDSDILISGPDSIWANRGDFTLGTDVNIQIEHEGLLHIGGTMTLGPGASIELDKGNLHFGLTDVESFSRIRLTDERRTTNNNISGKIIIEGFNTVDNLPQMPVGGGGWANVSKVQLLNKGIIYGNGFSRFSLNNMIGGAVNILPNEWITFLGEKSENSGLITALGGKLSVRDFRNHQQGEIQLVDGVLFGQNISNNGIIKSRGGRIYAAIDGRNGLDGPLTLTNNGLLEFTSGESEVYGLVDNTLRYFIYPLDAPSTTPSADFINLSPLSEGSIQVSNQATVTFEHKVVGGDITVYYGSKANFLGGLTGRGVEGQGKVFIDGHLEPRSTLAVPTPFVPTNDSTVSYDEWYIPQPPPPTVYYFQISDNMSFGGDVELGENAIVDLTVLADNQLVDRGADSIHVAGEFILNGELELSITSFEGLLPEDTFTLITAGNLVGEFDAIYGLELDGPLEWELTQTDTELFITAILPGDFNNDWVVDAADFTLWRDNFANGQTSALSSDFQEKMLSDYEAWHANYGVRFERPEVNDLSRAVGIPEPSTSLLLISLIAMSACKESRTK